MNILNLSWTGIPNIGGMEVYFHYLFNHFNSSGINTILLTGTQNSSETPEWQHHETILQKGAIFEHGQIESFFQRNQSKLNSANVINLHNLHVKKNEYWDEFIYTLIEKYRAKLCFCVHNVNNPQEIKFLIQTKSRIVVYSEFMASLLSSFGAQEVQILPYFFETDYNLKTEENSFNQVIQPTRFSPWKGSHLTISASLNLLEKGLVFKLYHGGTNDGWEIDWEKFVSTKEYKLKERIMTAIRSQKIDLTYFNYDDGKKKISESEFAVHPTIGEGFDGEPYSISAATCLFQKKPIIVSNSGNLPFLLKDYSAKIIVQSGDVKQLELSMETWLRDGPPILTKQDIDYIEHIKNIILSSPRQHLDFYDLV